MPEHAELATHLADLGHGPVHAEILVVLRDLLDQAVAGFLEHHEVLDDVEQPFGRAGGGQRGVEADDALRALIVDPLPFLEMAPAGEGRADAGIVAIGEQDDAVAPEDMRHGIAIIAQVLVIGGLRTAVAGLQFDEQQRHAVDEADQIGAALVDFAGDPELLGDQQIVGLGVAPIDHAGDARFAGAIGQRGAHFHAIA